LSSVKFLPVTSLVESAVIVTAALVQSLSSSSASGDLILPKDFHEWVYLGSPLTPNALNGGKAGFPEYHNVYIEPGSYEISRGRMNFLKGIVFSRDAAWISPPAKGLFPRTLQWRRCDGQGF